jgi:hypothetical protein
MPSGRTWDLRWRGSPRRRFDPGVLPLPECQVLDVLLHVDCFLIHLPREVIDTQFLMDRRSSAYSCIFRALVRLWVRAQKCSHQSLNVHLQDASSSSYIDPAQS